MKRRTGRDTGVLSPNLTPLLDVVLQLITFFMMLIHFGNRLEDTGKSVKLPVAPAALPGADLSLDRLVVLVNETGKLVGGGKEREGDEADAWWREEAGRRVGGRETLGGPVDELSTVVVVRGDRRASYGAIRRTISAAQRNGFAHFSLVVLRSEER